MLTILSPNRHDGRLRPIRLVVIHTMETAEGLRTAEDVAAYFAKAATKASAHVCTDADSEVRCVHDEDTAWAAPGANADGLQLEFAGRAAQTPTEWADAYSKAELERGAHVVARWCKAYGIPVRTLTDAQLADGKSKGVVTHAQVSRVFKKSDHTDPGKSFPMAAFLKRVTAINTPTPPTPPKPQEAPVDTTEAKTLWTTPLTVKGTLPDAPKLESPLQILTRIARNVGWIADELKAQSARLDALEDKS